MAQNKDAPAEALLRRALAIVEKTQGPDAPGLVPDLQSYAALLRKMGRNPEAIEVEARITAIRAQPPSPGRVAGDD